MKVIFTICSNNYLAQALVLASSVMKYQPSWKFVIGLVDKKHPTILYDKFPCQILKAHNIEPGINQLAEKYSIVELSTCLKPTFFQYFFEDLNATEVIYLDPDTCLFQPMHELEERLIKNEFVLTPHILTPIPLDQHKPTENLFLNYGVYNLGFLAVKKTEQTAEFLHWWKERTYERGYDRPAHGMFTDQLWCNLLPVLFSRVDILRHKGYNMGPWNLHERRLERKGDDYLIESGTPLVFYHFSGFHPAKHQFHWDYTRYLWNDRPDLQELYTTYRTRLLQEGYERYTPLISHYSGIRTTYLMEQKLGKEESESNRQNMSYQRRIIRQVKQLVPSGLKKVVVNLIKA
jgi:hypothetical protein